MDSHVVADNQDAMRIIFSSLHLTEMDKEDAETESILHLHH